MSKVPENIHPILDQILQREEKQQLLKQNAKVIWFTGLSGSGKSTIAIGVEQELYKLGYLTQLLDGDNVRTGICRNLGFSEEDRKENIRRIAEVCNLFLNCGVITLNCFVSPTEDIRQVVRDSIPEKDFIEIFVDTPLHICEARDVKGLYKKARSGEIKNFTGINAPFEPPKKADVTIQTEKITIEESVRLVLKEILPKIEWKK